MSKVQVEKTRTDWLGIFLVLGIISLLIVAIWALVVVRSQGSKCLANPIKIGAEKMAKDSGENVLVTVGSAGGKAFTYSTDIDFHSSR